MATPRFPHPKDIHASTQHLGVKFTLSERHIFQEPSDSDSDGDEKLCSVCKQSLLVWELAKMTMRAM